LISRRAAVTLLGAGPLTALAVGVAGGAHAAVSTAGADREALGRYVRMHWAADGVWLMWLYGGVLVVKPEGRVARPLVQVRGVSFSRALPQTDGSFVAELEEVGYYCDLTTGDPLTTLRNPFTERDVEVEHYRSPQRLRFSGTSFSPAQAMPPGVEFRGELTTLAEVGGVVAMTEDLYVRLPAAAAQGARPARPERFSASLATFTAPAASLADPKGWVASTLSYGTMNSFVRWLGMDGTPGVQNMRLAGAKRRATEMDAIAPDLRARIQRDHATFLDVPKNGISLKT
jgi:hypothetical protein